MLRNERHVPARRLVPVLSANENLDTTDLTLRIAKAAAARGETVLMLDCQNGDLMKRAGIIYNKSLSDVLYEKAELIDVKYVTSNEHFTAAAAGDLSLSCVLGSLVTLSLQYDWVFVGVESGCTPDHVQLAAAADATLVCYDTKDDQFMRAYWMIDAIRRCQPHFDPFTVSLGEVHQARESAELLTATVREFLGAPPEYFGHGDRGDTVERILDGVQKIDRSVRVA